MTHLPKYLLRVISPTEILPPDNSFYYQKLFSTEKFATDSLAARNKGMKSK